MLIILIVFNINICFTFFAYSQNDVCASPALLWYAPAPNAIEKFVLLTVVLSPRLEQLGKTEAIAGAVHFLPQLESVPITIKYVIEKN